MGYMMMYGECFGCKKPFTFNAERVPSIRVNAQGQQDPNGKKEPICKQCVERANPVRVENGLQPIQILLGAYEAEEVT